MPIALQSVWSRVAPDETLRSGRYEVDVSIAVTALRATADDPTTIHDLLFWARLRPDTGRGWSTAELIGLRVIRAFATDDDLVHALSRSPSPAVIAGARQFLDWHRSFALPAAEHGTRAKRRHKSRHAELKRRLCEVAASSTLSRDPPAQPRIGSRGRWAARDDAAASVSMLVWSSHDGRAPAGPRSGR